MLPVYIKAGAIIPMQPAMQWVDQHPVDVITLDVYPSGISSYEMYEDDGISMDYQKGIGSLTRFTSRLADDSWTFTADKPVGKYKPAKHTYLVKAYLQNVPQSVIENGKSLPVLSSVTDAERNTGWFYDIEHKRLYVKTAGDNRQKIEIVVQ